MAANDSINNYIEGGVPVRKTYTVRLPYFYQAKHNNDEYKNLGYNYTGKILKKVTSPELWANPLQIQLIGQIETLLTYVLEETKMIKKWFSIAHSRDTLNIN